MTPPPGSDEARAQGCRCPREQGDEPAYSVACDLHRAETDAIFAAMPSYEEPIE